MAGVRAARTRKPCPGCGVVSRYRPANEVCGRCETALKEHAEYLADVKDRLERDGSVRLVALAGASRWWPTFYYGGPRCHIEGLDETRQDLRDLFDRVARLVCKPLPENYYPGEAIVKKCKRLYHREVVLDPESTRGQHYRPRLDYPSSEGESGGATYALVDPQLADALQGLWDHVARFLHMSYLGGVTDGRDLLMQLASGEMSTDDLAKEDVALAKRVQTAGHLARALSMREGV